MLLVRVGERALRNAVWIDVPSHLLLVILLDLVWNVYINADLFLALLRKISWNPLVLLLLKVELLEVFGRAQLA